MDHTNLKNQDLLEGTPTRKFKQPSTFPEAKSTEEKSQPDTLQIGSVNMSQSLLVGARPIFRSAENSSGKAH